MCRYYFNSRLHIHSIISVDKSVVKVYHVIRSQRLKTTDLIHSMVKTLLWGNTLRSLQTSSGRKSFTLAKNLTCSFLANHEILYLNKNGTAICLARVNIKNMSLVNTSKHHSKLVSWLQENEKNNRVPFRERMTSLLPTTVLTHSKFMCVCGEQVLKTAFKVFEHMSDSGQKPAVLTGSSVVSLLVPYKVSTVPFACQITLGTRLLSSTSLSMYHS
jgi:hypothetical protein